MSKFDGILIGGHPYCRDLGNIFGDRIYQVKGLAALEVRVGRGKMQWDNMADTAADRLQLVRVGGSFAFGEWAMDYPQIDDLYLPNLAHEPLNHVIGRVAGALLDDASPEKAMGQALEEKRQAFETLIRKKAHPWGE